MHKLSNKVERKFTNVIDLDEWSIETDSGWHKLNDIKQTIKYQIWQVNFSDGSFLECADTHILFDENMSEVFVKDLVVGSKIQSKNNVVDIVSIKRTCTYENMYDVGVESDDQRYYSNGILSHNTTTAAGYLLWRAMFNADTTILVAAHKYSGAQEIMQRIRYAYECCPTFIKAGAASYNKGSLEFDNGSRIVSAATTENTGRGLSISLLYLDEFAFCRPTIAKEFWTSMSPTLSTGGAALITSTPNSDEDQFWQIWSEANKCIDAFGNTTDLGVNGFKAFKSEWWEHPDRDQAWADAEQGRIGVERFQREFLCQPIIFEETLISPLRLVELSSMEPIEKQGQVRWYKKPTKGKTYVVSLDPSLGVGGDNGAIQVFQLPELIQIGEWVHNRTPIDKQVYILKEIVNYIYSVTDSEYNTYYSIENNTLGEAALLAVSTFGEENIKGVFLSEPRKPGQSRGYRKGFTTTNKSKLASCARLKSLIEKKKMTVVSKGLISELKCFVSSGIGFAAKPGEKDDLVSATLLVVRMIQMIQSFDADIDMALADDSDEFIAPLPFIAVFG